MQINKYGSVMLRQYLVVIVVNFGILNFGLSLAWVSPVLVKLQEDNPVLGRPITEAESSWLAGSGTLSALPMLVVSAFLVDRIGRKLCVMLATIPRVGCFVLLLLASEVWMLMLARVLNGLADGIMFAVVSMYASEVASKEIRGSLGGMLQIFSSLGILTVYSIGPFLDYYVLNITILVICVVDTIPLFFIPDSPYFLYKIGKIKESREVLIYLRGSSEKAELDIKEYGVVEESAKLGELLKSRTFLKASGIVFILAIGADLSGFSALAYYLQTILESTKSSISSDIASVFMGCIQLTASLCAAVFTDKFGRKPMLLTGLLGTSLGMIGLGTFFYLMLNGSEIVGFLNVLPLLSMMLCIFSFSASVNSILWPLAAELFDGRGRPVGMALGLFVNFTCIFLVTVFFADLTNAIGPAATYWAFSINLILLAIFVLFVVPETKGKTINEIQVMLGNGNRNLSKEVVVKSDS